MTRLNTTSADLRRESEIKLAVREVLHEEFGVLLELLKGGKEKGDFHGDDWEGEFWRRFIQRFDIKEKRSGIRVNGVWDKIKEFFKEQGFSPMQAGYGEACGKDVGRGAGDQDVPLQR